MSALNPSESRRLGTPEGKALLQAMRDDRGLPDVLGRGQRISLIVAQYADPDAPVRAMLEARLAVGHYVRRHPGSLVLAVASLLDETLTENPSHPACVTPLIDTGRTP